MYGYKQRFKTKGILGLIPSSKRPKTPRKSDWDYCIIAEIRKQRAKLPNLGKEQLNILLKPFCHKLNITCPSASTIGRIISKAHDKMRHCPIKLDAKGQDKIFNLAPVTRRPKQYRATIAGELVGLDTIARRLGAMQRYIMTYIDENSN